MLFRSLKDPYAAVPSLNPANQRQFVVSVSKISPETERASREAFWYRQELLKLVRGTWKEESNGRQGDIELRGIRFSPRMVDAIKLEDVKIETSIVADYPTDNGNKVIQGGRAKYLVPVDEFLTVKTRVYNRSTNPILPLLRLQPHLAGLPHNIALDLDKRFSWSGALQRKLPLIQPQSAVEAEIGIVALCSGTFEVGATVEEIQISNKVDKEEGKRSRSGTLTQVDVLGEPRLRSWHLKEPCTIVASRDGGSWV